MVCFDVFWVLGRGPVPEDRSVGGEFRRHLMQGDVDAAADVADTVVTIVTVKRTFDLKYATIYRYLVNYCRLAAWTVTICKYNHCKLSVSKQPNNPTA